MKDSRLPLLAALATCALWGLGAGHGCDCGVADDDSGVTADDDTGGVDDDDDDDSGVSDDDQVAVGDPALEQGPSGFLPPCDFAVMQAFTSGAIDPPGQDSDGYTTPDQQTLDAVRGAMRAALAGEGEAALTWLDGTGYEVCRGTGDEEGLVLWSPSDAGTGQPLIVWCRRAPVPLVLGVPHPNFELGTLPEGVDLFQQLRARALIVSGTHRCADTTPSPCEGETSVCSGSTESFRESDMSHVVDSVFQVAHEVLYEAYPDDWFVSVHGMEGDGISVSDGTTRDCGDDAPVAVLGAALMEAFPAEQVTSCNRWSGATVGERFCGEFDVQGRLINGSNWPCLVEPSSTTDRFVHLEQSIWVRAQPGLVVGAFEAALAELD